MKLLMFDTNEFWFKTFSKTIESAETCDIEEMTKDSLVIFINVEAEDEGNKNKVIKRACSHILWLAKKNNRKRVILHFFAHLSESKSSAEFAKEALFSIRNRLNSKGLDASTTPFGYFLEFQIHVKGESLAKVWKSI
ncbi:MAG: threonyl-tRNA synthetase editing domain-containing protein [Methanotrichaceae archaeon]